MGEADALAALRHTQAELLRLRDIFAGVVELVTGKVAEQIGKRDAIIRAQRQRIALLQVTLALERARRLRPKGERGGG